MEKIYEQAKDLHVRGTIFYTSDNLLYTDPGLKVRATKEEVIDAFCKGTMIITIPENNNICKPIHLEIKKEYVSILCDTYEYGSDLREILVLVAGTPPQEE